MLSSDETLWRAEERPCPVCGSQRTKRLGARGGSAHRKAKGVKTDIVQCLKCKVIYTKPTLIPQTNPYAKQTAEEYFHHHESQQKIERGEALATFAEEVLEEKGNMLEIGCGRGELLLGAANRGWTVDGIEMTEEFAQIAMSKGIKIECSSVEESKFLDHTYDVILLAAVLEHLYDPVDILKRIHTALRPGGLVFIDVPNELSLTMRVGNWYMRVRGRDWATNLSPTFPPFHVVGFSPGSLKRVLTLTGFAIYKLDVPKWNNVLPPGNNLVQKVERWAMGAVQTIGANIGMGDGITCWAVRK